MAEKPYQDLRREELLTLLEQRDADATGGIRITYKGQRPPWQIVRRVKPRRQKIEAKLCVGSENDQSCNLLVEGENHQAMVALYKYRGPGGPHSDRPALPWRASATKRRLAAKQCRENERHHILAVGTARMPELRALHPGFEYGCDRKIKPLDALLRVSGKLPRKYWRQ